MSQPFIFVMFLGLSFLMAAATDTQDQPSFQWSQPLDPIEETANPYPFQIEQPSFDTFILNPQIPSDESAPSLFAQNSIFVNDKEQLDIHEDDGDLYERKNQESEGIYQQQLQLFPVPAENNWPPVYPPPLMRFWFPKAEETEAGDYRNWNETTTDSSTDESTTDTSTDYSTDSASSTDYTTEAETEEPTSTTDSYDDSNDDVQSDDGGAAGDQDVASTDDDHEPPVNVPSGSFFMQCLIHLMCGVVIALGADVYLVGKRSIAPSETELLVQRIQAVQILSQGLELGSPGRGNRCIERAACQVPRNAELYAKASDIVRKFIPAFILRWADIDDKIFQSVARSMRRGAKCGSSGQDCAKDFPCKHMDK